MVLGVSAFGIVGLVAALLAIGRWSDAAAPADGSIAVDAVIATATAAPTRFAPTPVPATPVPGQVTAGGDQPSGPLPPPRVTLPENPNAEADFLAFRESLVQEIADYRAQVGGVDVAIAVTDLQNGQTISVGGNVPHKTGCTINMFGLFAAVSEFQAGHAAPSSVSHSVTKGIGGSYPPEVKNFLDAIFGNSTAGVQRAREQMSTWGMKTSFFDHVPYYGGENPAPNILTALETNELFLKLWHNELFSPEWTDYTVSVLRNIAPYVQYILPKYLPPDVSVAHKIGYYWDYDGWVNNDAGIVTFTGGDGVTKGYIISYFSQQAASEKIGYSFGARLSRLVWDYMGPHYGVNTAPAPAWYPPSYEPPPAGPIVTPEPQPTDSPVPSDSVTPSAAPASATPTPKPATATPKPSATPVPTPVKTATPVQTAPPAGH